MLAIRLRVTIIRKPRQKKIWVIGIAEWFMKWEGMWSDFASSVFMNTVFLFRRPSDLVIYALREGQERACVAGTKFSTTRRASADSVLSERYLLRASVGISCSQSPFPWRLRNRCFGKGGATNSFTISNSTWRDYGYCKGTYNVMWVQNRDRLHEY